TLAKVALAAGVSKTTAASVLSGRKKMSAQTTTRVLQAAQSLGYRGDPKASGLSRGTAPTLGVLYSGYVSEMIFRRSSLFWPRFNEGLVQRCSQEGVVVAFASEAQAQALINSGADAILVLGSFSQEVFDALHIPFGMPVISRDPIPGQPLVIGQHDPIAIAEAVVTHLAEQGCTHVGWLLGPGAEQIFGQWQSALAAAAQSVDVAFSAHVHDGSESAVTAAVRALTEAGVNGIFSALTDTGQLRRELGIGGLSAQPEVLLVVQAEGIVEEAMSPSVSTLSLMSFESGEVVAGMCLSIIASRATQPSSLPFELTVRDSSRRHR
ncbi:MAG: LacI family DNA-binding transcriptional regulator, partial [Candidatus Nanopelagicales bacterium]